MLGLYCWAHEKVQEGYVVGAFGRGKQPVELKLFTFAGVPTATGLQLMTEDDAVLAVGFCRFAIRSTESGEVVTALAAAKVAAIAKMLGIHATCIPSTQWDWTAKLHETMRIVEESDNLDRVARLDRLLSDLSVSDVEGYEP